MVTMVTMPIKVLHYYYYYDDNAMELLAFLPFSVACFCVLIAEDKNEFPEQDVKEREVCDLTYVEMNKNRSEQRVTPLTPLVAIFLHLV